jgi:major membrane immunogen (membrane-anchored lipoprotein)
MKTSVMIALAILLGGCSSLKGTMLDGRICTLATADEVQKDIATTVESLTSPEDKTKVEIGLKTAKLAAATYCEIARSTQGAK